MDGSTIRHTIFQNRFHNGPKHGLNLHLFGHFQLEERI